MEKEVIFMETHCQTFYRDLAQVGPGAGSVVLDDLQEEKTYILTFSPTGPRVPQDVGQVRFCTQSPINELAMVEPGQQF